MCLEASDRYSHKSVDEKRCAADERKEYMRKLDETKNNEEVAFEFFKYAMTLDLTKFNVHEPYQAQLHHEQKSHNECALQCFLEAARCGEYLLEGPNYSFTSQTMKYVFTSLDLLFHFKRFIQMSGLHTNIESIKSLGWALKKYPNYVQKQAGRTAKYVIEIDRSARLMEGDVDGPKRAWAP